MGSRPRKEIDLDRARELYESGLTFGEVAAEMGGIDRTWLRIRIKQEFPDFVSRKGGWVGGKICSVDGCGEPHRAKGLCMAHYGCLKRNGDATALARVPKELPPLPPQERAAPSFSASPEAIKRAADRAGVSL